MESAIVELVEASQESPGDFEVSSPEWSGWDARLRKLARECLIEGGDRKVRAYRDVVLAASGFPEEYVWEWGTVTAAEVEGRTSELVMACCLLVVYADVEGVRLPSKLRRQCKVAKAALSLADREQLVAAVGQMLEYETFSVFMSGVA